MRTKLLRCREDAMMRTKLLRCQRGRDGAARLPVDVRRVPASSRRARRCLCGGRERRGGLRCRRIPSAERRLRGHDGAAAPSVGSSRLDGVRPCRSRGRGSGARPASRRGRQSRQGGRAVPRPFSRGRFGFGSPHARRFVVRRGAWFPLARRARRSSRQGARSCRYAQCCSRGAVRRSGPRVGPGSRGGPGGA